MLFNSIHFLLFFPSIIIIYFLIPVKYRWILLLAGSYYFYMCWKVEYVFLILFSTIVDYLVGIQMGKTIDKNKRKILLVISLVTNLGLLFAFKYFNFFNESVREVFQAFDLSYAIPAIDVLLPVGISFYTFQTLSYSIDVYRGAKEPEKHFGIFALFVSFFPQLVAGPIERSQKLLPQLYEKHKFDFDRIVDGLKLMVWGFFMKLVIADRLAIYVNAVYNNPEQHTGLTLALATVFFAFQIYCDFAGYSNIAIGAAKVMGVNLMINFNRPYFSKSISEFWKRWHISLSTWFRDYLYISLGGNRVSIPKWYFNLLIVFVISGLWHGANWTFVIWGALNGLYLIFEIITKNWSKKVNHVLYLNRLPRLNLFLRTIITFLLACFAWIFFRANSSHDAFLIINQLFVFDNPLYIGEWQHFLYGIAGITFLLIIEFNREYFGQYVLPFKTNHWFKEQLAYTMLLLLILLIGVFDGGQFIYFQF